MENLTALIVYYSFSGSTRKMAHAIQKGVSQRVDQCKIVALKGNSGISGMKPEELLEYDLIGFGSPIWSERPSSNMMSFIKNLPSLKGKYAFAFFTHGLMPGGAMRWIVNALKEKDGTVIGWNDWYAACFPVDIFKPYHTDGHPDEIDLTEATEFGSEMVERSLRISQGQTSLIPRLPDEEEYEGLYGPDIDLSDLEEMIKNQPVVFNAEKCTQCAICEENCPTGSIKISDTLHMDKTTCCGCWVCEQVCPTGAIEVDFEVMMKSLEAMRGKTNWQDMDFFRLAVERVDTDPRFRRLVPLEDVGKKGLWFELSEHPRIIIQPE